MNELQRQIDFLQTLVHLDLHVDVLDGGFVEMVEIMGLKFAHVDAARASFLKRAEMFPEEKNMSLSRYLSDSTPPHGSPWEMAAFKFRVKAPVIVWWHWVRHRIASYNFQSGRYVPFDETEVYRIAANAWRCQSEDNKQASSGEFLPEYVGNELNLRVDALYAQAFELYEDMLDHGVAREQARLVLPFAACYYVAIVKMNARSLKNFIRLRKGSTAQHEIRVYADAVHELVMTTHPILFPVDEFK